MNRLKEVRKRRGLTQKELASKYRDFISQSKISAYNSLLPITYATISRWEKGEIVPKLYSWDVLSEILNCSPNYLQMDKHSFGYVIDVLRFAYEDDYRDYEGFPSIDNNEKSAYRSMVSSVNMAIYDKEGDTKIHNDLLNKFWPWWVGRFEFISENKKISEVISMEGTDLSDDEISNRILDALDDNYFKQLQVTIPLSADNVLKILDEESKNNLLNGIDLDNAMIELVIKPKTKP